MSTKLENLLLRQEQLNAQIKDLQSREKKKKQKADTHAKILLGATLLSTVKNGSGGFDRNDLDNLANSMTNKKDKEFLEEWMSLNFN